MISKKCDWNLRWSLFLLVWRSAIYYKLLLHIFWLMIVLKDLLNWKAKSLHFFELQSEQFSPFRMLCYFHILGAAQLLTLQQQKRTDLKGSISILSITFSVTTPSLLPCSFSANIMFLTKITFSIFTSCKDKTQLANLCGQPCCTRHWSPGNLLTSCVFKPGAF